MTRTLSIMTAACAEAVIVAGALVDAAPAGQEKSASEQVKRGAYLVSIAGCNDCHTPLKMGPKGPEPDLARMLSGHPSAMVMPPPPKAAGPWNWSVAATSTAFAGPWGVSYAINLTSDSTGLGNWTEAMFIQAMRSGKHAGVGRPILPPMPWQNLAAMTDVDMKAVFAYLRSTKPVSNVAPPAQVAPPPGTSAGKP